MIEHGAALEVRNKFGETALVRAAYEGGSYTLQHGRDCVGLLLEKRGDMEVTDNNGNTALLCAAQSGCIESVKLLVDQRANLEARGHDGSTALLRLAYKRHQATPFGARDAGVEIGLPVAWRLRGAECLVLANANLEARDYEGHTVLMRAMFWGNSEVVQLCLAHGAQCGTTCHLGQDPLMQGIQGGRLGGCADNTKVVDIVLTEKACLCLKRQAMLTSCARLCSELCSDAPLRVPSAPDAVGCSSEGFISKGKAIVHH